MNRPRQRQTADEEQRERHQVLRCLSRAEALRDSLTNEHEELVGVVALILCQALGFSERRSEQVAEAARLHDIGKFALPSDILHKPGRLSREEWAIVRKHSEIGHGILRIEESPFLQLAASLALCHHERYDGGGYPFGLSGDAIPLEARIVSVADSYEALRAERAYKRSVDHDRAVAIILEGDERSKPAQFDPQVLGALERASETIAKGYREARSAILADLGVGAQA